GSDVAGIKASAKRVDGGWLVNGSKMFITNGVRADFYVTALKTTGEGGHHGLSFLIVDKCEGVHASAIEKLGRHASDTGLIAFQEVTMAKLVTQRACFDVMDTCLQIHGGAGYMKEYEIERMARDARLGPIGGGTDEIMREILGKTLGL